MTSRVDRRRRASAKGCIRNAAGCSKNPFNSSNTEPLLWSESCSNVLGFRWTSKGCICDNQKFKRLKALKTHTGQKPPSIPLQRTFLAIRFNFGWLSRRNLYETSLFLYITIFHSWSRKGHNAVLSQVFSKIDSQTKFDIWLEMSRSQIVNL